MLLSKKIPTRILLHCIALSPQPVGVQCLVSPFTSSLGECPDYWDWLRYPWLPPVSLSIAFSPFAFHISVLFHSLYAIGFHSCFFVTTDVSAPIRSTLHLLMVSSRLGTFSGTRCCDPEAGRGGGQKSVLNFFFCRGC